MRVFLHETCGGLAYAVNDEGFYETARVRLFDGCKARCTGRQQFPYAVAVDCLSCGVLLVPTYTGPSHHHNVKELEGIAPLRVQALLARHAPQSAARCSA